MAKTELKQSIFRVLSDLIKSDNVITIDELDELDSACGSFGICPGDKEEGFRMTLSAAMGVIASQGERMKRKVLKAMEDISLRDGECCRAESLLISAMEYLCEDPSSRVLSMEFRNRPLTTHQLLYIENRKTIPARVELDTHFVELSQIVKMGGLDLIYIPRVAQHFREYAGLQHGRKQDDLKRVLRLISPQSDDEDLENTITAIQGMSSKNFYNIVLNGKLDMNLDIEDPSWVLRLPDSVVSGVGYANFLCLKAKDGIRAQLQALVDRLNSRQNAYSIVINDGRGNERNFLYNGFYKALLDVMSVKKIEKWDLHIRLYGDGREPFEYTDVRTGKRKKCIMTIRQGEDEFPVPLSGREVAYYLLVLCGSASPEGGVDFHDGARLGSIQEKYSYIYQRVSKREGVNIPDVTIPEARRPMKSYVCKAINESEIARHSALQGIYLPEELPNGFTHVDVDPERVIIDAVNESKPLRSSLFYKKMFG